MGFVLGILYFVTNYLTPVTLFGPLAAFHIELILAVLVFFASLFALPRTFIHKTPQSLALLGSAIAVFLSVLIGMHWAGGAPNAFLGFIPNAFAYLLVCLHCNSKKKLQVLVLMMLFVCLFVIAHGLIDLHGFPEATAIQPEATGNASLQPGLTESDPLKLWNLEHPYLLAQRSDAGEWFYRLRGLGLINDPNDFGQLIVCVIPLMFIFWRTKQALLNFARVTLPVCILLFGVYLTHSRGALVALVAMVVVAARRRIGTLPAVLVAGGLFVAAMAMHFTGGRGISAESGADRTELWSEGLQLLKAHPLFGVGFGNFADYSGHTAHNSIVVCAAELGLFGLFFWSMFLLPTVRDALALASPAKVSEGEPVVAAKGPFPQPSVKAERFDKAEANRLGHLVLLSLIGFLVAGMFLSRAYVLTLFLLGGMAEVAFEMALRRKMIAARMALPRVLFYSFGLTIFLVLMMYIVVRILNLMH